MVTIRAGRPDDAAELTELTMRSKAHWGYDDAFLAAVRDELTLGPDDCDERIGVAVGAADERLGYYRVSGEPPIGELESLFVDPPVIGTGVGGLLIGHALAHAGRLGFRTLTIDADPGAEPFYRHAGARRVGEVPSGSIAGRVLPRLEITTRLAD